MLVGMNEDNITTSIKFKLYFDSEKDKREMDEFFDEYAKAVTFAARVISKLRKPFRPLGKYVDKTWVSETGVCSKCKGGKELYRINTFNGEKLCKDCYYSDYSDTALRKRIVPAIRGKRKGEKIDGKFNLRNVTTKISPTHMHYAVRDALQILDALKEQRKQKWGRYRRDMRRLREFEEMISDPSKRVGIPPRKRQREPRYVPKSQEDRINELRGYTLSQVNKKIQVLKRNIERDRKSLMRPTPIHFKGTRITLAPSIKFDVRNNRARLTLREVKWYGISGTNVASERGRKYFLEKLKEITKQKPKYAYIIRKQIGEYGGVPIYEYYLQYTVETIPKFRLRYTGVLGIDRGITKLATVVFLAKDNPTKPRLVKFFRGDEISRIKIVRRKQKYALTGVHHRREKMKRMRFIEPKIEHILHNVSKEIVALAMQNKAAIAIEKLEKMKKGKTKQRRRERYKLSLGDYNKLAQFISYKAKKEGIKVFEVSPEGTSYTCSHCVVQRRKEVTNTVRPYKNTYSLMKCNECGVELNSDYNAAFNVAWRGLNSLTEES